MCLLKQFNVPQKNSNTRVKVYKFLLEDNTSPYRFQKYHSGLNVPDREESEEKNPQFVTAGYLHAYTSREIAAFYAMKYQQHQLNQVGAIAPVNVKVVEMYIPEDTEYWVGFDKDVAAKKLYWPEDEDAHQ